MSITYHECSDRFQGRAAAGRIQNITWLGVPLARSAAFSVTDLAVAVDAAATALAEAPEAGGVAATAIEVAEASHRASKRNAGLFVPLQLEAVGAATETCRP